MKSRVCVICGREFTPAKKSRATTCSRECWRELMRRNAVLPVRPAQKHVRICENCGREFVVTGYSVRKTCSAKCKQEQIARKASLKRLSAFGVGWIGVELHVVVRNLFESQTPFGFGGGLDKSERR